MAEMVVFPTLLVKIATLQTLMVKLMLADFDGQNGGLSNLVGQNGDLAVADGQNRGLADLVGQIGDLADLDGQTGGRAELNNQNNDLADVHC